jgi:N-methylhydantoinase A/oxoprolinase/acetone carboxylase beta subunit
VTLGSDILREVREFERGSTAALNDYLQPIVWRYLGRLSQNLRSAGLSNELLVMQGNGGVMAGYPNLVACDMGGTSFDVSLIAAGEPALSAEKDIAYGVPLRVPLVDIHTIKPAAAALRGSHANCRRHRRLNSLYVAARARCWHLLTRQKSGLFQCLATPLWFPEGQE